LIPVDTTESASTLEILLFLLLLLFLPQFKSLRPNEEE